MNEYSPADQRELEHTTSRQIRTKGNGSGQHDAYARQAWLNLGAAVETTGNAGLDQQALLASLQTELVKQQPEKPADDANQVDWSWAAVVMAASVLIVATAIGVISQRPEQIPSVVPGPRIVQPVPQPAAETPPTPAIVSTTEETNSWTDLDDAINTTYTAIQQLSSQPSGVDRSLTDFDTQLKQLSADIADESL